MGAHFITGTGTDIGKTWLACSLLRHWRGEGLSVTAIKPVLSGFDVLRPQASDAGALLEALGRTVDQAGLDSIAPWRFAAPLSPDIAAAQEGRTVDFDQLLAFTRLCLPPKMPPGHADQAGADSRRTLVEGVGGVMAPLDAMHTVRDWIAASGLPCVLVAGSYLGSLSHALTALESLRKVGAGVTAIVVNETPGSTVTLDATLESLSRHAQGIPLLAIGRAAPQDAVAQLAGFLS